MELKTLPYNNCTVHFYSPAPYHCTILLAAYYLRKKSLHRFFPVLITTIFRKKLSIKDVCSQEEGVYPVRRFFGQGEGFMRTSAIFLRRPHFFVQTRRIFRNIWCVRTNKDGEKGEVERVRTFFGQEVLSMFRDFVRTFFMDGPAPKTLLKVTFSFPI